MCQLTISNYIAKCLSNLASFYCNTYLFIFDYTFIFLGANLNSTNLSGQTALHSAAETGQINVVQFLIEENVDPFKTDVFKLKAIDIAKMLKRTEIQEMLSNYEEQVFEKK